MHLPEKLLFVPRVRPLHGEVSECEKTPFPVETFASKVQKSWYVSRFLLCPYLKDSLARTSSSFWPVPYLLARLACLGRDDMLCRPKPIQSLSPRRQWFFLSHPFWLNAPSTVQTSYTAWHLGGIKEKDSDEDCASPESFIYEGVPLRHPCVSATLLHFFKYKVYW